MTYLNLSYNKTKSKKRKNKNKKSSSNVNFKLIIQTQKNQGIINKTPIVAYSFHFHHQKNKDENCIHNTIGKHPLQIHQTLT